MSPGFQKGNRCKVIGIPAGTPIGNHNVFIQCSGREILIVIDTVVKHDRYHTGRLDHTGNIIHISNEFIITVFFRLLERCKSGCQYIICIFIAAQI